MQHNMNVKQLHVALVLWLHLAQYPPRWYALVNLRGDELTGPFKNFHSTFQGWHHLARCGRECQYNIASLPS